MCILWSNYHSAPRTLQGELSTEGHSACLRHTDVAPPPNQPCRRVSRPALRGVPEDARSKEDVVPWLSRVDAEVRQLHSAMGRYDRLFYLAAACRLAVWWRELVAQLPDRGGQ